VPAVFVHGVPDTAALWEPLLAVLGRDDVLALTLPGFGAPVPSGFGCTKDEYAAWVAAQVRAIGEPVDLVGHDWGALIVQRVATTDPELTRTWVIADGAVTERFGWHDLACQWQTPDVGEQVMELMTGEALTEALRAVRHPEPEGCAARVDDTMRDSILRLYRSALDIADEWAPRSESARPGLVVWGSEDPYGSAAYGRAASAALGAAFLELDAGHWSLVEYSTLGAEALSALWESAR
jgi:pimeloyl-ACP methyl ester carboxylesterase